MIGYSSGRSNSANNFQLSPSSGVALQLIVLESLLRTESKFRRIWCSRTRISATVMRNSGVDELLATSDNLLNRADTFSVGRRSVGQQ